MPDPALRRITVVDDSPEFIGLLRDIFTDEYDLTAASHESINAIADTIPHLLIVELHVGNDALSGGELVRLARRHKDLRRVPIIVCTGDVTALNVDGEHLTRYSDVHLLTKPFALEVIEKLVDRLLRPVGASLERDEAAVARTS